MGGFRHVQMGGLGVLLDTEMVTEMKTIYIYFKVKTYASPTRASQPCMGTYICPSLRLGGRKLPRY